MATGYNALNGTGTELPVDELDQVTLAPTNPGLGLSEAGLAAPYSAPVEPPGLGAQTPEPRPIDANEQRMLMEQATAPQVSGAPGAAEGLPPMSEADLAAQPDLTGPEMRGDELRKQARDQYVAQLRETERRRNEAASVEQYTALLGPVLGPEWGRYKAYLDDAFVGGVQGAMEDAEADIAGNQIVAGVQNKIAGIDEQTLRDTKTALEPIEAQVTDRLDKLAKTANDIMNFRLDPGRAWHDKSLFAKTAIVMGAGFAGALNAMQGRGAGENPVVTALQRAIELDMRGQQAQLDQLFRAAGNQRADIQTLNFQEKKIRANMDADRMLKIAGAIAKSKADLAAGPYSDKTRAQLTKTIAALEAEYAKSGMAALGSAMSMYGSMAQATAKSVGTGAGGAGADDKRTWAKTDPFGLIEDDPKTGDFRWKEVSAGEREKFRSRTSARYEAIQDLNELAVLTKDFRELGSLGGKRFSSERQAAIRQIKSRLTNIGRKMTESGANFTKLEMDLINEEFGLIHQGLVSGEPGVLKRLKRASDKILAGQLSDARTRVLLSDDAVARWPKSMFVEPKDPVGMKGVTVSSEGTTAGGAQAWRRRAKDLGTLGTLEEMSAHIDALGASGSMGQVAHELYQHVLRHPKATPEAKKEARQHYEKIANESKLVTLDEKVRQARLQLNKVSHLRIVPGGGEDPKYTKAKAAFDKAEKELEAWREGMSLERRAQKERGE